MYLAAKWLCKLRVEENTVGTVILPSLTSYPNKADAHLQFGSPVIVFSWT